jgi:hypothetical protein
MSAPSVFPVDLTPDCEKLDSIVICLEYIYIKANEKLPPARTTPQLNPLLSNRTMIIISGYIIPHHCGNGIAGPPAPNTAKLKMNKHVRLAPSNAPAIK